MSEPTRVDLHSAQYSEAFENATTYQKNVRVSAVQVTEPTPVRTVLADGTVETEKIAQPTEYIVTNPGGEQYVISEAKFHSRYDSTDVEGVFSAKGRIKAIKNDTGSNVVIDAPWGSDQFGGVNCYFAKSDFADDRYIIGGVEFFDTYVPVES